MTRHNIVEGGCGGNAWLPGGLLFGWLWALIRRPRRNSEGATKS
jgi:hypothetical protein